MIAFVEDPDGYKIELIEEKDAGRGPATNIPRAQIVCARSFILIILP